MYQSVPMQAAQTQHRAEAQDRVGGDVLATSVAEGVAAQTQTRFSRGLSPILSLLLVWRLFRALAKE